MPLKLIEPGARKGNTYYLARGTVAGKRIECSLGTRDRTLALEALRTLELHKETEAVKGPQITFAAAALAYMDDGGEKRYLPPLLRYFPADTLVADINPQDLARAAHALYPNAQAATRRRQALTPARAVIAHHQRGGMRPKSQDTARTRWLSPTEAEALIIGAREVDKHTDKGPARAERLILTLLGTGCRTGELVRLQTSNINANTAQAWINNSTNIKSPRWVSIERGRAFPAFMAGLPDTGAAFRTPKGEAYKSGKNSSGGQFAGLFNKARDHAGLGPDVTPHVCRHTWATWFYAATGHNLAALMSNGGWAKADMAMRYTKLAPADLAEQLVNHGWQFAIGGNLGELPQRSGVYAVK
jgi:integrase